MREADPSRAARILGIKGDPREHYVPVNLRRALFNLADLRNGLVVAIIVSINMTMAFGFLGHYLSRLRAAVAFSLGDGLLSNAAAVAIDAALGVAAMAGLINPLAGLGVPFSRIIAGSASGTLARGCILVCREGLVASFFYAGAP